MPKSLGAKAVSVHGCFPPHAMRLAKAMLEAGLYSEETINVKGVEATPLELMHEILLQKHRHPVEHRRADDRPRRREASRRHPARDSH